MKLAVASGKGGTGKTTLATNLAVTLAQSGKSVAYLDCDVEEPNGHIFLKPPATEDREVTVPVPGIIADKCTYCGVCADLCEFKALAVVPGKVLFFPELCHSCGGCYHLCPEEAIEEVPRRIGLLRLGQGHQVNFGEGCLDIGEAVAPPVIQELKTSAPETEITIIDAPPGTSCPVIETVKGSDYVVLVTEPTPFGMNDLRLAVDMLRTMELPFGIVVNRSDGSDDIVVDYCREQQLDLLAQIPDSREYAETYSRGELICDVDPDYATALKDLFAQINRRIAS